MSKYTFEDWCCDYAPMHYGKDRRELAKAAWNYQQDRIDELEQPRQVTQSFDEWLAANNMDTRRLGPHGLEMARKAWDAASEQRPAVTDEQCMKIQAHIDNCGHPWMPSCRMIKDILKAHDAIGGGDEPN